MMILLLPNVKYTQNDYYFSNYFIILRTAYRHGYALPSTYDYAILITLSMITRHLFDSYNVITWQRPHVEKIALKQ